MQKRGLDNLFQSARKNNIAIIARETLLRGFLTGKYQDTNKLVLPEAVKKEIDLFGKEQILAGVKEIKNVNEQYGDYSLAQLAIRFAISNQNITIAILGINRISYIKIDLESVNVDINKDLISNLKKIPDLEKC